MSDLEKKSKKELLDIIDQLREKLENVQGVEQKQVALESKLKGLGFSIVQDLDDTFKLVKIGFDFNTKAARIEDVIEMYPSNYEYSLFEAKKFLVQEIMSSNNLNHLRKE